MTDADACPHCGGDGRGGADICWPCGGTGRASAIQPERTDTRPRLLDLFCGAGGCSVGYARAGFDVTGVDITPHPDYPFPIIVADALEVDLTGYDVIHASPPCQSYVQWNNLNAERYGTRVEHPRLIEPTRERLRDWGGLYVIENVVGAPLHNPVTLCGSMFGLGVRRHRLFETDALVMRQACQHTGNEIAVYGWLDGRRIWTRTDGTEVRAARTLEQAGEAMGIDWMTEWDDMREAVPPAYTEYVGEHLLAAVGAAA